MQYQADRQTGRAIDYILLVAYQIIIVYMAFSSSIIVVCIFLVLNIATSQWILRQPRKHMYVSKSVYMIIYNAYYIGRQRQYACGCMCICVYVPAVVGEHCREHISSTAAVRRAVTAVRQQQQQPTFVPLPLQLRKRGSRRDER